MKSPDSWWKLDPEYAELYKFRTQDGTEIAAGKSVCILAIARNAYPHLPNTLALVEKLASKFAEAKFYVYENDSTDATQETLIEFAKSHPWATVESSTLHRPDYRGFEEDRTIALAEYRNRCQEWARANMPEANYVIVLDMDPAGGFSVDGVLNSIGWLEYLESSSCTTKPGCMASHSLWLEVKDGAVHAAAYDAWAARLNWWEDRRMHQWFHSLLLPVGSPPVPMNSAFGGLAVYRGRAFFSPGTHYQGGDCEHVALHKGLRRNGYQLYLNPGCRYSAVIPDGITTPDS